VRVELGELHPDDQERDFPKRSLQVLLPDVLGTIATVAFASERAALAYWLRHVNPK
jgi:hypothetical protein